MGTTVEKFARAFQTKADLRNTINTYLGQDITNIAPFKDYETYIRNFYNQAPKTEFEEGTDITIENGLKGKLDFEKVYQEVEYIESSSTQFIDTGIKANSSLSIDIDYMTSGSTLYHSLFGSKTSSKFFYYLNADGSSNYFKKEFGYYNQYVKPTLEFETNNVKTKLLWNGNTFSLTNANGTYNGGATASTFSEGLNLYLFAFNDNGSAQRIGNTKIYSCKIKDNNTLVRDMIPCYRKSDNVIGMYDKVNNKFYTNAGTGTFTKGADVGSGFGDMVGYGDTEQGENPSPTSPQEVKCVRGRNLSKEKNGNNIVITDTLEAGTYTFSLDNTINGGFNLKANSNTGTTLATLYFSTEGRKTVTFTLSQSTKVFINGFSNTSGTSFVEGTDNFQLEEGSTATPYIPYNTLDVVVRAKNLFNGDVEQGAITAAIGETYAQNKVDNATRIRTKDLITLNKNKTYTISCKSGYNIVIQAFNDNKTLYVTSVTNAWVSSATFTNIPYIAVAIKKTSEANITPAEIVNAEVQLETGSTATPYQLYANQTLPLNLGSIELNKIGDYQDYIYKSGDKWYKKEQIGKVTLVADNVSSRGTTGTNAYYIETNIAGHIDNTIPLSMSNMFQPCSFNDRANGLDITYLQDGILYIRTANNTSIDWSTLDKAKTWVTTNAPIVYYVLATATDIEITDTTMINQLEEIYNMMSINGTTIIESNGDLPMIIKVRALKGE